MARDRAGTALLHLAGLEDWANTEAGGKVVEEVEEVEDKQTTDESPVSTEEVVVAADDDCIPQMDPTLLERVKGL